MSDDACFNHLLFESKCHEKGIMEISFLPSMPSLSTCNSKLWDNKKQLTFYIEYQTMTLKVCKIIYVSQYRDLAQ